MQRPPGAGVLGVPVGVAHGQVRQTPHLLRRAVFLRGEERYKYDFEPTPEDVYALRIGP